MADAEKLKNHLTVTLEALGRDSVVVGLSGGIDSAVTAALAVAAIGRSRVSALALPEKDSSPASTSIASEICDQLGIELVVEDLTSTLDSMGVYAKRDEAIRSIFPQYLPPEHSFSMRLVQNIRSENFPALYEAVLHSRSGETVTRRVRLGQYMSIFSASNSKQRLRTLKLYEYAELHGRAVLGTSNWDETYLGFFVKGGDGAWDVCMLNECTKMEVWELAERLGLPASVTSRTATTDTFPDGGGSQTDMFYTLPFEQLDVLLDHMRGRIGREQCLSALDVDARTLEIMIGNLERRHRSTEWNRSPGVGYSSVFDGE